MVFFFVFEFKVDYLNREKDKTQTGRIGMKKWALLTTEQVERTTNTEAKCDGAEQR